MIKIALQLHIHSTLYTERQTGQTGINRSEQQTERVPLLPRARMEQRQNKSITENRRIIEYFQHTKFSKKSSKKCKISHNYTVTHGVVLQVLLTSHTMRELEARWILDISQNSSRIRQSDAKTTRKCKNENDLGRDLFQYRILTRRFHPQLDSSSLKTLF